jgi:hypothetical protein
MATESAKSSSWLEPLVLREASERAQRLSDDARARMNPWVVAAQARFRVARELRDPETQAVALGLLREAAFFALCALEVSTLADEPPASSPEQAWQRFDQRAEKPPGAPEHLALVRSAFGTDDALSVDRVPQHQANELRLAAEASVAWLLSLVEIRTLPELTRVRLIRIALAVVGLVVIVWGLVAYWSSLTAIEPR